MISTKIRSGGRLTIPPEVRDALRLAPGDTIIFDITGRSATIYRENIVGDPFYLFDEWKSDDDCNGYKDL